MYCVFIKNSLLGSCLGSAGKLSCSFGRHLHRSFVGWSCHMEKCWDEITDKHEGPFHADIVR